MPGPTLQGAATAASVIQRLVSWLRRPFIWLACKVAGIDAARELLRIENARLVREHERKICDELDQAANEVERLGPQLTIGSLKAEFHTSWAAYVTAKHRLRDLHADLPALCDATALGVSTPPEWQKIVQLARPAIAERLRRALQA